MSHELPHDMYLELSPQREEAESIDKKSFINIEKLESPVGDDEMLKEMLEEVFDQCARYTKTVIEQQREFHEVGPGEEHSRKDEMRSLTHTATQDTIRMFVRALIKSGKTPDEIASVLPDPNSRAKCGNFALMLTLSRGKSENIDQN